jgi:hypothetical protein
LSFTGSVGIGEKVDAKTVLHAGYSVNFVNDEFLVALTGNAGTNVGLS